MPDIVEKPKTEQDGSLFRKMPSISWNNHKAELKLVHPFLQVLNGKHLVLKLDTTWKVNTCTHTDIDTHTHKHLLEKFEKYKKS